MTEIYGNSEDPWPYEYLINGLLFFAMEPKDRDEYIVSDFPQILFHGAWGDWLSSSAKDSIFYIFRDIVHVGNSIDEWICDAAIEELKLEPKFFKLNSLIENKEFSDVLKFWSKISVSSRELLSLLGWQFNEFRPFFTCTKLLDEYSYGAYGELQKNA